MTKEKPEVTLNVTTPDPIDHELKKITIEQARLSLEQTKRQEEISKLSHKHAVRKIQIESEVIELDLAKRQRDTAREMSSPEESLTYTFYESVNSDSVKKCLAELDKWARRFPGKPITIVLNSPGGSVIDGLGLFDYIQKLRADGHYITMVVLGMAASMGGILLQAGDKRVVGKYSQVLIHEVSAGSWGNVTEMHNSLEFIKSLWKQLADILAKRSVMTAGEIKERAAGVDWWLTSAEAVKLGFADEILPVPAFKKK